MMQSNLPPGYEIVPGDTEFFVKKHGQYVLISKERKMQWPKKASVEKSIYKWCWETYRAEENIRFEDYAEIVQIIPAQPSWGAVILHDGKDDLYEIKELACWARVEIFYGPYKRTLVVGMVANEEADENDTVLTAISKDNASFLGYTFPGDESDWKHVAYNCILTRPSVSSYKPEDVLLWMQEEAEQQEQNPSQELD